MIEGLEHARELALEMPHTEKFDDLKHHKQHSNSLHHDGTKHKQHHAKDKYFEELKEKDSFISSDSSYF